MKPSEKCKAAGLKSLAELSEMTGQSVQTLNNWHKHKPRVFELVLKGAAAKKLCSGNQAGCPLVTPPLASNLLKTSKG